MAATGNLISVRIEATVPASVRSKLLGSLAQVLSEYDASGITIELYPPGTEKASLKSALAPLEDKVTAHGTMVQDVCGKSIRHLTRALDVAEVEHGLLKDEVNDCRNKIQRLAAENSRVQDANLRLTQLIPTADAPIGGSYHPAFLILVKEKQAADKGRNEALELLTDSSARFVDLNKKLATTETALSDAQLDLECVKVQYAAQSAKLKRTKARLDLVHPLQANYARYSAELDELRAHLDKCGQGCIGCGGAMPTILYQECGHLAFCQSCFEHWEGRNEQCPVCRMWGGCVAFGRHGRNRNARRPREAERYRTLPLKIDPPTRIDQL